MDSAGSSTLLLHAGPTSNAIFVFHVSQLNEKVKLQERSKVHSVGLLASSNDLRGRQTRRRNTSRS
jgi:hypothetical protein